MSDTADWTWGWGINLHPWVSLDILFSDGPSPAVDSAPKGPGISARTHPSQEHQAPHTGSRGPCKQHLPLCFYPCGLWLTPPPPCISSTTRRLEVIWGCETTLHVQRHPFKVTFTLWSVVKSIRPHITSRAKVALLLILAEATQATHKRWTKSVLGTN